MKSSWRARSAGDRHAVPVEMRFIDMFMAALGALIFMAMLLAFLLKYLPPPDKKHKPIKTENQTEEALEILTRSLPQARVGEPYEVAFAYRGGRGKITWEIIAGEQEIPAGMQLDPSQGVLAGTPSSAGTSRFILSARDIAEGAREIPYELLVVPSPKETGDFSKWIAIVMVGATLLIWLVVAAVVQHSKKEIADLEGAWGRGERTVVKRLGGVTEYIELPEGIGTKRSELRVSQQFARFLLLVLLVEIALFAWRVWLA